jgi:hypothetical protein
VAETITAPGQLPNAGRLLAAQVHYQLRLLLRSPRALGAGVAIPALLLLLSPNPGRDGVPAAHLAGLAVLGVTTTAWVTHGIGLVAAREAGVLKRWRATPLPPWCYLAGRIAATLLMAIAAAAVTVAVGVTRDGTRLDAGAAVGVLVAVGLGALAWAAAATALTGVIPNVESASPILTLTYLPAGDPGLRTLRRPRRPAALADHPGRLAPRPTHDRRHHPRPAAPRRRTAGPRSRPGRPHRLGRRRAGRLPDGLPLGAEPARTPPSHQQPAAGPHRRLKPPGLDAPPGPPPRPPPTPVPADGHSDRPAQAGPWRSAGPPPVTLPRPLPATLGGDERGAVPAMSCTR